MINLSPEKLAEEVRNSIESAIADVEKLPCVNPEYSAGYAQGVVGAYLRTGLIEYGDYDKAVKRISQAHEAAIRAKYSTNTPVDPVEQE